MFVIEDHDQSQYSQMEKVDRSRSYDRLRKKSNRRKGDQLTRLEELEAENLQLREAISNLKLDKLCLQESVRALPGLFRDH